MKLELEAGRITRILAAIVAVLLAAHLVGLYAIFVLEDDYFYGYIRLFDLDEEPNVPTFYSAASLLFAALILAAIAGSERAAGDRFARHWAGLAVLFVFLAVDEGAAIHEEVGVLLAPHLETSGLLYYRWLIPYGAITVAVALLSIPFLRHLPAKTRILFLAAGVIYVTGALGFEALQGRLDERDTRRELAQREAGLEVTRDEASYAAYGVLATCEELLEMIGVVLFIHALLDYAGKRPGGTVVTLTLTAPGASAP